MFDVVKFRNEVDGFCILLIVLLIYFASMPLNRKKTYSRFNVGAYMKAMKLKRECLATNHQDILNKQHEVNKAQSKLNRLTSKVQLHM